MAHKQPDFRQNPPPANRGSSGEGGRTDEVIGRFQSASTGQETPVRESSSREREAPSMGSGGGLGRFFRAASERLTQGRGGTRRAGGTFGRDEERSFEASGYGDVRTGRDYGRDSRGSERGSERDYGRERDVRRERPFDDMDERQTRHHTPYDEVRDIQRRGYPEATYAGGERALREDRGQYSDFGGTERSARSGRELGRRGWQREPLTAHEIMTRSPRSVRRETLLRDAAQIMKDENVGIVPVVDEAQRLVGVLTDRDIVIRAFVEDRSPTGLRVAEVMTDDVEAVTPEESLHEVIELMGRKQVRRVPVVDREDRLLGIIAMADIANRAEQDEELQAALERISARRSFWSRL